MPVPEYKHAAVVPILTYKLSSAACAPCAVACCVQLEYASSLAALERGRIMAETKDRHVDDVAHDVELAGGTHGVAGWLHACLCCPEHTCSQSWCHVSCYLNRHICCSFIVSMRDSCRAASDVCTAAYTVQRWPCCCLVMLQALSGKRSYQIKWIWTCACRWVINMGMHAGKALLAACVELLALHAVSCYSQVLHTSSSQLQACCCRCCQALASELRSQHELLSNAQHDKLVALRAYKAAEVALAEAQETLPPLKIARCVNWQAGRACIWDQSLA